MPALILARRIVDKFHRLAFHHQKHFHTTCRNYTASNSDVLLTSELAHRGLVRASGRDCSAFLQGLITNDMTCLDTSCGIPCMYAMLLNTKGRVLYDLILYHHTPDTYLIECNKDVAEEFISTIRKYKIRKKVDLALVSDEYKLWAVYPQNLNEKMREDVVNIKEDSRSNVIAKSYDPRLKAFSRRLILPSDVSASQVLHNTECASSIDQYHERRFYFGIGEGTLDMPPGNALPLDSNAVFMNGVSFNKGCYVGQELTARTHHTGVVRKRLMPVCFESAEHGSEHDASIENNKGKRCGKLRDSRGTHGLAMLRLPDVIGKGPLSITQKTGDAVKLDASIPWWWPAKDDPIIKQCLGQKDN